MRMKLAGHSSLSFVNNMGETIKGTTVYVLYESESVTGFKADKLFLKEGIELPKDIKPNEILEIEFDNRGKVISVNKAQ